MSLGFDSGTDVVAKFKFFGKEYRHTILGGFRLLASNPLSPEHMFRREIASSLPFCPLTKESPKMQNTSRNTHLRAATHCRLHGGIRKCAKKYNIGLACESISQIRHRIWSMSRKVYFRRGRAHVCFFLPWRVDLITVAATVTRS